MSQVNLICFWPLPDWVSTTKGLLAKAKRLESHAVIIPRWKIKGIMIKYWILSPHCITPTWIHNAGCTYSSPLRSGRVLHTRSSGPPGGMGGHGEVVDPGNDFVTCLLTAPHGLVAHILSCGKISIKVMVHYTYTLRTANENRGRLGGEGRRCRNGALSTGGHLNILFFM